MVDDVRGLAAGRILAAAQGAYSPRCALFHLDQTGFHGYCSRRATLLREVVLLLDHVLLLGAQR